jgi:group I intron endonuclease
MLNLIEYSKDYETLQGIYCIANTVDNRVYIGSTKSFKTRLKEHKKKLNQNLHENRHLQNFYNKYGKETLSFYIVEVCELSSLLEREQHYLDLGSDLFNIAKIAGAPPSASRSWSYEEVLQISFLYNTGKTCCQISEILYNNRNYRTKINLLVKGESYKEYKYLFNKREYTQKGKFRYKFRSITPEIEKVIKDNMYKLSGRNISNLVGINKGTIAEYIKIEKSKINEL